MQACCVLWATLGFKKAAKACFNYPALVLTPCFGTWTFGPAALNNESTSNLNYKISVSYKHTWVTFGISLIGAIVTSVVGYENSWRNFSNFGRYVTLFFTYVDDQRELRSSSLCIDYMYAVFVLISGFLIIVILPILTGFVQGVDNC